ncbi:MAG: hypothetical protein H0X41_09425 [Chitinophagaceae bacterium]|nr:hypothetical protein [Chitinophagaceae bacterium]
MSYQDTYQEPNRRFDQLSVAKLIVRVRQVRHLLLVRWGRIIGFGILFSLACSAYFYFKDPVYPAEVSFVLDEQSSEIARADFSDLPAGLGLRQTVDPSGSVFSTLNNVVELISSRMLIEKTLKSQVSVNGKSLVLADFFLDSLDYRTKWINDPKYAHLNFRSDTADAARTLYINSLLGRMYDLLNKKIITIEKKGKGTSIIGVTCTSKNELFSKYFIEALIRNTEQYYTETKTQRAKINLEFIRRRTDSVKAVYNAALYGKAVFTDANVNPGRQVAIVSGEKQQTDILILRTAYIELARTMESAKTSLSRDTPLFQYLDTPVLPLKKIAPPLLIYFFIFFIAGIMISSLYLLFNKWVQVISRQEDILI